MPHRGLGQFPTGADPGSASDQKFTWQYGIEWRLVRAGSARMTWTPDSPWAFQADLHIESAGMVSKLYRVNDDYRVLMKDQFCASTVNIHAEEGKRRRETNVTFADGKAAYSERDLVRKRRSQKRLRFQRAFTNTLERCSVSACDVWRLANPFRRPSAMARNLPM